MTGRALIGHTGFVGSNLARQGEHQAFFNSRNFRELAGRRFDEVVCAGVQAVKWWANQNPEEDAAGIAALRETLEQVETERFTLISTIDVYARPQGVDEADPVPAEGQPYGRHRREFEMFVAERFPGALIVRLPGLFGRGLKKNLIFDALEGKDLSGFDRDSAFQFYHLDRLSEDIARAQAAGLDLVNFATPPVTVAEVMRTLTGEDWTVKTASPPHAYDMRTRHAALWGRSDGYLESKDETLGRIAAFAEAWRAGTRD